MAQRTNSLIRYLLLLALAWGVGVRFVAISQWKQGYSHDESISYLCASATEGRYTDELKGLSNVIITADDIHAFYQRPDHLQTGLVAYNLAHHDIHPPLYFWALHAAYTWTGAGLTAGTWLNFLAGLILLWLTFTLARETLGNTDLALAATVIWYLSPAVAQVDLEARHYQFMAVCAMASYILAWRMGKQGVKGRHLVLFILVNALGFLSHYYYGFVLLPGVWLIWRQYGLKAPFWRHVGSIALSVVLFMLVFPDFLDFVANFSDRPTAGATPPGFIAGVFTLTYTTLEFLAGQPMLRYPTLALIGAVAGLYGYRLVTRKIERPKEVSLLQYVTVTLVWCAAFTVVFYLARISPASAAGEQYNAYFWPLLAIVLVHVARTLIAARHRRWILVAYVLLLGYSFTLAVRQSDLLPRMLPDEWYAHMAGAGLVVTDDLARGILPRVTRDIPAGTPLYLMRREADLETDHDRVAYLHLQSGKQPPSSEIIARMARQGYALDQQLEWVTVPEMDSYRLLLFRR